MEYIGVHFADIIYLDDAPHGIPQVPCHPNERCPDTPQERSTPSDDDNHATQGKAPAMCNEANRFCDNQAGDDHRPLDVDSEQLGDGYSGFVIVRLSRELPVVKGKDLRSIADKLKLGALVNFLICSANRRPGG